MKHGILRYYPRTCRPEFISGSKRWAGQMPKRVRHDRNEKHKPHDRIVALVDRMLAAKEELSKARTEAETSRLERECESLERQIDQAVYELYVG